MLQYNKFTWVREEALASITAVGIVELPMSDRDQAIETEFDQKESKFGPIENEFRQKDGVN